MYLDYNISSGPFLSYEIEIGDGQGPKLGYGPLTFILMLKSYMVVVVGGGGGFT